MPKGAVFYTCYVLFLAGYAIFGLGLFWGNQSIVSMTMVFAGISAGVALMAHGRASEEESRQSKTLRELIKDKRSMPVAELARQADLQVSSVARIARQSGFVALSSDGSAVLNLERLTEELLSHVDSMGQIDVAAVSANWSVDAGFLVSFAQRMSKSVTTNKTGKLYSRAALDRIVETELATKGTFNPTEEAMKRGLTQSGTDGVFSSARVKTPILVTTAGVYLHKDTIIRNLKESLEKKGVLDLSLESRKLGVYGASVLNLVGALADESYVRIPATSLIAKRFWLDEVTRNAKQMGAIDMKGFADQLGISRISLSVVLSNYVQGYLDESTDTFYTSGIPVYYTAAARPRAAYTPGEALTNVQVLRGGEFVGNRLRYKVKILNNTRFVITDVTVSLVSYPRDALTVEGPIVKTVTKVDPGGFDSPLFQFLPSKDCVKGDIIAMVCYVDHEGKPHTAMTEPFTVRAVCDLLIPENISPEQFELRLSDFNHGEMTCKVTDWTPEEMHSKALQVLEKSNFSEVTTNQGMIGEHIQSKITGWARGKYTKKNLAVELTITGRPGVKGATCSVKMSGEDEAMIMPAIDEMCQNLTAWLCPMCGGDMPDQSVTSIREGKPVKCPFCGTTVGR